jgi:hypothetical protein
VKATGDTLIEYRTLFASCYCVSGRLEAKYSLVEFRSLQQIIEGSHREVTTKIVARIQHGG